MKEIERLTEKTKAVIAARKASQEAREKQAQALEKYPEHSEVILRKAQARERKAELQEAETALRTETATFFKTAPISDLLPYGLKVRVRSVIEVSEDVAHLWCLQYAPVLLSFDRHRYDKAKLSGLLPDAAPGTISEDVKGTIPTDLEIKE